MRGTWPTQQPALSDGQVLLRPWRPEDAPAVFEACQDPDIQRFTRVPVPYLTEHAHGFIADAAGQWADGSGALFAVADPAGRTVLGSMSLMHADHGRRIVEAGYWTAPWGRSRGITRAALLLITRWALVQGGFDTVTARVAQTNHRSAAVVEAAGFVPVDRPVDVLQVKGETLALADYLITRDALH